jgi:hypothetical protein
MISDSSFATFGLTPRVLDPLGIHNESMLHHVGPKVEHVATSFTYPNRNNAMKRVKCRFSKDIIAQDTHKQVRV